MKAIRILALFTVLVCLSSCGRPKWHTLSDGNKFYGKLDGGKSYYWEGNSLGKLPDGSNNTCLLPDGEGYLVAMKANGKEASRKKKTLYYGTENKKYPYPAIQSGRFHGKTHKTKHDGVVPKKGFGVLIQDDVVYCGNFNKDGQLDGKNILVFKNKEVVYFGEYKDGLRSGEGKEYRAGDLYYSGSWKNDMKDGRGTMYYKGSVQYDGKWKEDTPLKDFFQ